MARKGDSNARVFIDPVRYECSPELIAASKKFRQGDLLKDVPVGYVAPGATSMTAEGREEGKDVDGPVGVRRQCAWAMLVSQTCDLQHDRKILEIPLLSVAPVYDAKLYFPKEQHELLEKPRTFEYLVRVASPELPVDAGQVWVANLRYDLPIDRGFLLNREPIGGFKNEDGYIEAGKQIGRYRARAAIDDVVESEVLQPLKTFIRKEKLGKPILEVWVRCEPTFLKAKLVKLHLLVEATNLESVAEKAAEWYSEAFYPEFVAKGLGIIVRPPLVELLSAFGRDKMRGSVEVDLFGGLSGDDHR
jgi:hypothetical protein